MWVPHPSPWDALPGFSWMSAGPSWEVSGRDRSPGMGGLSWQTRLAGPPPKSWVTELHSGKLLAVGGWEGLAGEGREFSGVGKRLEDV